jgi:hypothetical protein
MNCTLRTLAAVTAAGLLLTGCSSPVEATTVADGPALPTPSATSAAPSTPVGPARSVRGNIPKALGQEAYMMSSTDAKKALVTFTVDSITPDQPCTVDHERYGDGPSNGHFIGVQLRLSTAPEMTSEPYLQSFMVWADDFSFVGSDGITHDNLATSGTRGCLDDSAEFTSDPLSPGSAYVGSIVLDVPVTSGTLIYAPGSGGGWEWSF